MIDLLEWRLCDRAEQGCWNEPSGDATQGAAEKRIVSANVAWEFQRGRGSHAQSPRAAEDPARGSRLIPPWSCD